MEVRFRHSEILDVPISVNDEVVHGIPNDRPLEEGDIVSVDCGTLLDGYNGDSCYTFCVGEVFRRSQETFESNERISLFGN